MLSVLYSSAGGLEAASKTQDVLARNIAGASQHGYRRATVRFADELQQAGGRVVRAEEGTSFEQGQLVRTDAPLDLALEGDGFFTLQKPDGDLVYTRRGSFTLGANGRIVTTSGLTVLGTGGPILLAPGAQLTVGADGTLLDRGNTVGTLRIASFPDPSVLAAVGTTLFAEKGAVPTATPAVDCRVRQGFLENSNVDLLAEMVRMVENTRAYQASAKAASAADSALGQLREVAEV